jgi:hypothetical protein
MTLALQRKSSRRKFADPKVIFTAAFLLGLLALVALRTNGWRWPAVLGDGQSSWFKSAPATPEDAIYAMLDAARAGDTRAYLDAFSGPMRDQLLQIVKESSEPNFAAYLKSQNAAFQGVAVSLTDHPSDTEAQVRVEYVYSDRNEVQSVSLREEASRWKIFKVAGAEQVKTLVPFGTAVTD